ncbi:type II secretion system protein [Ralstonia insidiosa]|nr:type II secretion system protein [Ralstonia insidiosa]
MLSTGRPLTSRPHRPYQRGAILIESLIALAILSLGAAAMFRAFDFLEAANHEATRLDQGARARLDTTEMNR